NNGETDADHITATQAGNIVMPPASSNLHPVIHLRAVINTVVNIHHITPTDFGAQGRRVKRGNTPITASSVSRWRYHPQCNKECKKQGGGTSNNTVIQFYYSHDAFLKSRNR